MRIKNLIIAALLFLSVDAFTVNGADRALVVGVDFYRDNTISSTDGAVSDARAMQSLLIEKFAFAPGSIKTLLNEQATARNITDTLQSWLVNGTRPGDRVFFYYAGHGFQAPDDNGDEDDKLDELVTPYDVKIGMQNGRISLTDESTFIRDDRFNDFIVELTGRRVVLMFDSCNSGTISRGVGDDPKILPSRYLRLKPTRSIADRGYSDVPKDGQPRDRSLIREESLTGKINGVVVLTAASPYQQAFPIVTPDKTVRGAFTYTFEQLVRRNAQEKLSDLENDLKREMKSLAATGVIGRSSNGEYQVPQVDVISKTDLADKPLFAASSDEDFTAAAESALFNPLSPIKVKLETGKRRYRIGEEITYTVDVGDDLYLYVLVFSGQNKAFCIFPTADGGDTDNFVKRGRIQFPRDEYVIEATEPAGKDVWVALASRKKLKLGEKQEYTWDEMFERIGLEELRKSTFRKLRGTDLMASKSPESDDWQADSVVVETIKR